MQLPAPRTALFALVLLVSFVCRMVVDIYSLHHSEAQQNKAQAQHVLSQLGAELVAAMLAKDGLSLSLITSHYKQVPRLKGIAVIDTGGNMVAKAGRLTSRATKNDKNLFLGSILHNEKNIGSIQIRMARTSTGEFITKHWSLFLFSAVLHLLIWFCYVLLARQRLVLSTLKKPVGNPLGKSSTQPPKEGYTNTKPLPDSLAESIKTPHAKSRAFPKNQVDGQSHRQSQSQSHGHGHSQATTRENQENKTANHTGMNRFLQALAKHENPVILQIQFDDPKHLLTRLAPGVAQPYYTLCNRLLNQAAEALSDSKLISQAITFESTDFAEDGVHILVHNLADLTAHRAQPDFIPYKDVAIAAVLLAKLYNLIHDVIYTRHREIGRFALPSKACISQKTHQRQLANLLEYQGKTADVLVVFDSNLFSTLKGRVQLASLPNPSTVLEREVGFVDGLHASLATELVALRDAILSK